MARTGKVTQRFWTMGKSSRSAWGYSFMQGGRQVRCFREEWTKEDADQAMARRKLGMTLEVPAVAAVEAPGMTFGQAVERYLVVKAKKRSIHHDRCHLARLTRAFGAGVPLSAITAGRISEYKQARLSATIQRDGTPRPLASATVNRELAALRHLFKLAAEEWEVITRAPRIRLEKEPEGRIRWLEPDEEARLMDACRASRCRHLGGMVYLAAETGMRRGEIMGLTWEDIDLTRGVIRLERTKGGRRREIRMRQGVYNMLAARTERRGRLWPAAQFRKAYDRAVEAAGLKDFTFHDLRHHFASWFVMRGGSLQALREILGHRDMALTLRYAHLSPGHLHAEMERTAGPFSASSTHEVLESPDRLVTA